MRISLIPISNIYTQSFGTKKPEIRKADDIQRKTRDVIPFFSPSYAKSIIHAKIIPRQMI